MSVKLFVGGLAWGTDDRALRTKFEEFGTVEDAVVIRDRESGKMSYYGDVSLACFFIKNGLLVNSRDFQNIFLFCQRIFKDANLFCCLPFPLTSRVLCVLSHKQDDPFLSFLCVCVCK